MRRPSITAIHESAHALIAHLLGEKVSEIAVKEDETGYTAIHHSGDKVIQTCVMIAGHEAEVLYCGRDIHSVPSSDWNTLSKIKTSSTGANIVRREVVRCLKGNKRTLFHLARIIDERKKVTRRIFLREFRKAWEG